MIRMITASTREAYDVDAAVQDILGQLGLQAGSKDRYGLQRNSVGIISCAVKFIDTGILKALSDELPFDVVGITARGNAAGGQYGFDLLCLSVLTSDDVSFSTVLSRPLSPDNIEAPVKDVFSRAFAVSGKPSFILAYPPLIRGMGAWALFEQINRCAGDVPVFGSLSCDDTVFFISGKTIWNGRISADAMAMIFMYGEVKPLFFTASLPVKNLIREYGVVTESEAEIVKKVNNMLFPDFLKTLYLTDVDILHIIPFIINCKNHAKPLVTSLYSITPEGYGVFGNNIPAGSNLTLGGCLNYDEIMSTTEDALEELFEEGNKISCALMYPCAIRNIALGVNADNELERAVAVIGNKIPYQICYSGGQICPVKNGEGVFENHIHNYAFTVCAFAAAEPLPGDSC